MPFSKFILSLFEGQSRHKVLLVTKFKKYRTPAWAERIEAADKTRFRMYYELIKYLDEK